MNGSPSPLFARVVAGFIMVAAIAGALWWSGAFLPQWSQGQSTFIEADLNGDGAGETIVLREGRLAVFDEDGMCWESQGDWVVSNVHVGDITHDGTPEVIAVVWKRGSFGTARPFWVEDDSFDFSQHVFIYDFDNRQLVPQWMSSALGFPVAQSSLDDLNRLHLVTPDGDESVWEWLSWGLVLVEDETEPDPETALTSATSSPTVTILAVGDIIAHQGIYESAWKRDEQQYDFSSLFDNVRQRISQYDLAAVNQETPFVHDRDLASDFPLFGTPVALGDAFAGAGFDIVTAATNHANDKGEQGISDTLGFWTREHPEVVLLGLHATEADANEIRIIECDGIRIAVFDYTFHLNGRALPEGRAFEVDTLERQDKLEADVRSAENQADFSLCFLHIGEEYAQEPTDEQRALCAALINDGADVVICSHSHVLQPVERVTTESGAQGTVFWSLGNFVSNQMDPNTVLGGAACLTLARTTAAEDNRTAEGKHVTLESYELVPTVCHFEAGSTAAYFLDDYTEALAQRHFINQEQGEGTITLSKLQQQWEAVSARCS